MRSHRDQIVLGGAQLGAVLNQKEHSVVMGTLLNLNHEAVAAMKAVDVLFRRLDEAGVLLPTTSSGPAVGQEVVGGRCGMEARINETRAIVRELTEGVKVATERLAL